MSNAAQAIAALFSMSGEAAVGVENGIIVFMNAAAIGAMGEHVGEAASEHLPPHLLETDAESFVCSATVAGRGAAVSAAALNGLRVFLISFKRKEPGRGDMQLALEPAMREALANLKLASERMSAIAVSAGDERIDYCSRVQRRAYYQLWRLLRNVSSANFIERGELPCYPRPMDIAAVCRELAEICTSYSGEQGVSIVFTPESGSIQTVADAALIRQMLLNLICNSLLHMPEGGTIRVAVSSSCGSVIISVDDDGEGIAEGALATVLCRWLEPRDLTDAAAGAGLGLSVARGIAEAHGGALVIESRSGKGCSVRVMLPADNEPTLLFSAADDLYSPDAGEDALTFLSTWLPTDNYGAHPDE